MNNTTTTKYLHEEDISKEKEEISHRESNQVAVEDCLVFQQPRTTQDQEGNQVSSKDWMKSIVSLG